MSEESKEDIVSEEEIDNSLEQEVVEQTIEDIVDSADSAESEEISELRLENENLNDRLLRLHAEFENFKRRTEKERISERKYKAQDILADLLPVIDNFDRALQTDVADVNQGFLDGMKMVYNQLEEALANAGAEKIKTENEVFDPNLHHAVMQVEDDSVESNIVVEELQTGYLLKDRVIRPAMVKVNK